MAPPLSQNFLLPVPGYGVPIFGGYVMALEGLGIVTDTSGNIFIMGTILACGMATAASIPNQLWR